MKSQRWFLFFLLMSVAAGSFAGDIQVSCKPGLSVYLDDQYMGESTAMQDGLFLMNVKKGTRTIRVEKDGFVPRSIEVEVSDFPIEVRVGNLIANPGGRSQKAPPAAPARKEVGYLIVTSAPQNCVVELDGTSEVKQTPQISFDRIDAGKHNISFSKDGYETISGVVSIPAGAEVTVRGNLFDGTIETVHEGRGSLRIYSKPKACTIRFRGKREDKIHVTHNITQIPAGEYPIEFEIEGRELSTTVLIRDEMKTILEVSFIKGNEPFKVSYVPH